MTRKPNPLSEEELEAILRDRDTQIPFDTSDIQRLLDTADEFRVDNRRMLLVIRAARDVIKISSAGDGPQGRAIQRLVYAFKSYDHCS